ncbi:hypothetical protein M2650_08985 [Luteimonas sp. SX5]|uniref:DUF4440 domain-containing protein n=1 Tax=Luteimonas galliterrae TaxID=2940486 RepID=A0ABT0MJB1_9GAMM|nr:hypothetical protein [Luteimonas galliterrae]MCL1634763.1 hypothetical protein [Luteimonas galliterrae]
MNKLICAAVIAMLLSGCDKLAPPVPEAGDTPTKAAAPAAEPAPANAATASVPAAENAATPPAHDAAASSVTTDPATDPAADKAVDDAIDDALGDHIRYRAAFDELQRAVAAKDAAAVAALVQYPLVATIDGKKATIKDSAAFAAQYDKIVTPAIADVVTRQKYSDLFVNYKGVMFGSGQVWLNGICKDNACKQADVKVVAIQPG